LATIKLRDRDAIITADNIIFRVYGYFHPSDAYVCDPEYASATIYKTMNPRAPRGKRKPTYYKFYADEGLRFVQKKYPHYTIFYEPLQKRLVGVPRAYIAKIRKPDERFQRLITKQPEDDLLKALHNLSASRRIEPVTPKKSWGTLLVSAKNDVNLVSFFCKESKREACCS
jgi:Uncharacterized protein conserved in archaea